MLAFARYANIPSPRFITINFIVFKTGCIVKSLSTKTNPSVAIPTPTSILLSPNIELKTLINPTINTKITLLTIIFCFIISSSALYISPYTKKNSIISNLSCQNFQIDPIKMI